MNRGVTYFAYMQGRRGGGGHASVAAWVGASDISFRESLAVPQGSVRCKLPLRKSSLAGSVACGRRACRGPASAYLASTRSDACSSSISATASEGVGLLRLVLHLLLLERREGAKVKEHAQHDLALEQVLKVRVRHAGPAIRE